MVQTRKIKKLTFSFLMQMRGDKFQAIMFVLVSHSLCAHVLAHTCAHSCHTTPCWEKFRITMLNVKNRAWTFSEPNNSYYSTPTRITVHEMHFHYECNARGLDGKVDGNLPFREIVLCITRNVMDGKADGNFNYKMYYFSKTQR